MKVCLITTYELGHQPFGIASPARWLEDAGAEVACIDLAVDCLNEDAVRQAELIAIYLPMHTATRLAAAALPLADVRQQVDAGAQHVTFGDPDFFNGPGHAMRLAEAFPAEFPNVTYDATIKVEHLLAHPDKLRQLAETGCLFVTTSHRDSPPFRPAPGSGCPAGSGGGWRAGPAVA